MPSRGSPVLTAVAENDGVAVAGRARRRRPGRRSRPVSRVRRPPGKLDRYSFQPCGGSSIAGSRSVFSSACGEPSGDGASMIQRGGVPGGESLAAQAQRVDQLLVAFEVCPPEVVQMPAAPADHHEKTTL